MHLQTATLQMKTSAASAVEKGTSLPLGLERTTPVMGLIRGKCKTTMTSKDACDSGCVAVKRV